MPYPGGKEGAGTYQRIINQIPPHDVYVEAFLGNGAVLRRKLPAARTIAIELNPQVAQSFAAGYSGEGLEVHCCCGIEWLKHAAHLYRILPPNPPAPAEAARSNGQTDRYHAAGCNGVSRAAHHRSHDPATTAVAAEFTGPVRAAGSADARSCGPSWFVYLDPPYLLSTRSQRRRIYKCEFTDRQHVELLDVARRLPCNVALSGYFSPLYHEALQTWRRLDFDSMTRGGKRRECLWMNYPEPIELHDYRYLGEEKRERERIARKVRTWAAGLRRLDRLERLAILDELRQLD